MQFNYKLFLSFIILFYSNSQVFSQAGSYYNTISTSSPLFISDLENRIRIPYTRISYDNYDETNIANFASVNNGNGTRSVFCVYSGYEYIYSGTFTWGVMSREHTWAHSWMPTYPSTSNDQYSDQHHLFPTHQNNANNRRSNHPFGIVANITYQFLDGKIGTNTLGQIVYEPRNVDKGDAVRGLLYMGLRYDGISGNSWSFNWLNDTKLPSLGEDSQEVAILLNWNLQDPPDKMEIDRNNYVQSIQQNRNPFTDHPEYINYIDFNDFTKLNPVYSNEPLNHVTALSSNASGTTINLNWNDATGSPLPSGYLLIAYNKDNYFLPVDGSVYNIDTNLADGYAAINIPYSNANTYSFNNLNPSVTYYFTLYSYNGTLAQTNYKIDGILPRTNSTVPNILASEPTNHLTNFYASNVNENSLQLNWTDALPGSQVPSGYLLIGNNNNTFVNPSDGITYSDDIILSDGSAVKNLNFASPDIFSFTGLFANTNYYFRIYSYNGSGSQINYKTDGTIPQTDTMTSGSSQILMTLLLDNFNRSNNNLLGTALPPASCQWLESETISPSSISLTNNRMKNLSTISGREFAYVNASTINGYPVQFNSSSGDLTWALNMKQSRTDPSGFDGNNYGMAFIIGKTTTDITTGNGYAVVIGQSGGSDAIRLAKFTGGLNANSKFINIISGGDYANQYLSIKVIYSPVGNTWSLFVDSSSTGFPDADPRNTSNQLGMASDGTYSSSALPYMGTLWNHATSANDSSIFDDIYVPASNSVTLNLVAIIEGFFNAGANNLNIRDSLTVYLRNSTSPYLILDSAKSVIDSNSFTGSFNFLNNGSGSYFISINHRNSIETWSKFPQLFSSGAVANYNFTTSIDKAFGNNLTLKNGKYCLYSGDTNQDDIVDASDLSAIDNDASNFVSGYVATDLSGDNFVDASDASIADNNASNFIVKIIP
ncbi:MAG: endonuclease [Ignavibacteria bacterium]